MFNKFNISGRNKVINIELNGFKCQLTIDEANALRGNLYRGIGEAIGGTHIDEEKNKNVLQRYISKKNMEVPMGCR